MLSHFPLLVNPLCKSKVLCVFYMLYEFQFFKIQLNLSIGTPVNLNTNSIGTLLFYRFHRLTLDEHWSIGALN